MRVRSRESEDKIMSCWVGSTLFRVDKVGAKLTGPTSNVLSMSRNKREKENYEVVRLRDGGEGDTRKAGKITDDGHIYLIGECIE